VDQDHHDPAGLWYIPRVVSDPESEVRLPPPAPCAACGRQLEESRQECPHCFGEREALPVEGYADVERLLRCARARMLCGLWILGIVLQPLAFESATRARMVYAAHQLDDDALRRRILHHQVLAAALFGLALLTILAVLMPI